jgi:hypothetical protein
MVEREALLDPTGQTTGARNVQLAARTGTLRGTRLALLNNTKPNSAVVLEQIASLLQEGYGVSDVMMFSKSSFAVPADDKLLTEISERCDVALAGVGD